MPKKDKPKAPPTLSVRLQTDIAELADILAPIFGKSVPVFLSELLRPILQKKKEEAGERLKKWAPGTERN